MELTWIVIGGVMKKYIFYIYETLCWTVKVIILDLHVPIWVDFKNKKIVWKNANFIRYAICISKTNLYVIYGDKHAVKV